MFNLYEKLIARVSEKNLKFLSMIDLFFLVIVGIFEAIICIWCQWPTLVLQKCKLCWKFTSVAIIDFWVKKLINDQLSCQ